MRFYFQDAGQKVATKCIRVASDATVSDVIGMVIVVIIYFRTYLTFRFPHLLPRFRRHSNREIPSRHANVVSAKLRPV